MPLSRVFKALADDTRLRMLALLADKQLCVCQIGEALGMPQPSASKHLNKLRDAGIIECNKISQWCFYRYQDTFKKEYSTLYAFLTERFEGDPQCVRDRQTLEDVIASNVCCQQVLEKIESSR